MNHGAGEYARDEDGDGFHEIHVNTMEGFLVAAALLATPASGHFAGEVADLLRLLAAARTRA